MSDDLIDQLRRQAFGWCQQMCNEAADEIERLKAIVDAIPDKDDPVGWVQEVRAKRMGVPTPSEALQMQVTINRELQAEIDDLRALRDAIPGDDKLAVAEWAVRYCSLTLRVNEVSHGPRTTMALVALIGERSAHLDACPPSVRAALRSSGGGA